MTQELIKSMYLDSVKITNQMESDEDYDGREYDYQEGFQNALTDLYHKLYSQYLPDVVSESFFITQIKNLVKSN